MSSAEYQILVSSLALAYTISWLVAANCTERVDVVVISDICRGRTQCTYACWPAAIDVVHQKVVAFLVAERDGVDRLSFPKVQIPWTFFPEHIYNTLLLLMLHLRNKLRALLSLCVSRSSQVPNSNSSLDIIFP
jgi:hypothetical protein